MTLRNSAFGRGSSPIVKEGSQLKSMWDTKRQIIWLVAGITFGTFIIYNDARDETGRFDRRVFVFWEFILLAIILTLFYLYSRKKKT